MTRDDRPVCAMTIAGSDPGGGAGIQADLKTFAAHGIHGLSAITALTAQHTRGITAVHVVPTGIVRAQIDACFDDFRIGAVKIGMLATAEMIHSVADALDRHRPPAIILDPVMVATSGASLLAEHAVDALRSRLLPMATLLTPNIPEAAVLLGRPIDNAEAADAALLLLRGLGAGAVLLKGGHLEEGPEVVDRYDDGIAPARFAHPRLALRAHGTGCTFAAAVAANVCRGRTLAGACHDASDHVFDALRRGYRPGLGDVVVLGHYPCAAEPQNKKAGE